MVQKANGQLRLSLANQRSASQGDGAPLVAVRASSAQHSADRLLEHGDHQPAFRLGARVHQR